MRKKQVKALVLFSGGLDSMLAVKLLQEQGIGVELVFFVTNFCQPDLAHKSAKQLGVPLREENISGDFLKILRKPKYGYGAGLNPCIDCHALMLKKAGGIMRNEKFDFVATGEVLGERPMSQNRQALEIVEKEAGLEGYLLRPLSAKLLEPTIPELDGRVSREKLLDIRGRSRKVQMALAKKYSIKKYPSPAGGCALTQEGFSARLKELMAHKPSFTVEDVDLVAIGRHFWPFDKLRMKRVQIILGRNKEENEFLKKQIGKNDVLVIPVNFSGPEALIWGQKIGDEIITHAKELIIKFSPKAKGLAKEKLIFKIIKK
jgi:tRNA U34 2-thiouridine synthase MnmA/TrmU